MENKWKFLDGDTLKIIALVTMLVDHIGAALIETMLFQGKAGISYDWYEIDTALRGVGRTAFPIFAFLLVEGFFHTHSRRRYFGRLALFAFLSEVPFDLAFHGVLFYRDSQNVFWTLTIGYLVIWGMQSVDDWIGEGPRPRTLGGVIACLLMTALCGAGLITAGAMQTDYQIYGVFLIFLFYLKYYMELPRGLICFIGYLVFLWEPWCIVGFLLILFYNGAKKKRGKGYQYFFYLFYPVHLLILGLLRVAFFAG